MAKYFNEQKWAEIIRKPEWYVEIVPELNEAKKTAEADGKEMVELCKKEAYGFFEYNLNAGNIVLGTKEKNWDKSRAPIDTIVIHHTGNPSGMTKEYLSAMGLIGIYAPIYENPGKKELNQTFGEEISSGHVRKGKQVFYPYHWIIRMDYTVERLLYDTEVGWHSGDWDMNCRSVGIVLDNDFTDTKPNEQLLCATANLIRASYSDVPKERILGHSETDFKETACPSEIFLFKDGEPGWKSDLLNLL